jgi:hypothetical protein
VRTAFAGWEPGTGWNDLGFYRQGGDDIRFTQSTDGNVL